MHMRVAICTHTHTPIHAHAHISTPSPPWKAEEARDPLCPSWSAASPSCKPSSEARSPLHSSTLGMGTQQLRFTQRVQGSVLPSDQVGPGPRVSPWLKRMGFPHGCLGDRVAACHLITAQEKPTAAGTSVASSEAPEDPRMSPVFGGKAGDGGPAGSLDLTDDCSAGGGELVLQGAQWTRSLVSPCWPTGHPSLQPQTHRLGNR